MTIKREDLTTMDFNDAVTGERLAHVTPGDVLRHEFLEPLGLSARAVARDMGVPVTRITEILNGERAVTAETALRLGRRFGLGDHNPLLAVRGRLGDLPMLGGMGGRSEVHGCSPRVERECSTVTLRWQPCPPSRRAASAPRWREG